MTTLEFSAVRASVAQAVKQAEQARQLRIESIDRQLPALESDLATKQQEVAALRAERERLQAQTGHDLVAEMLGPLEYRRVKDIPQALFDAHDGVWLDEAGDLADMKPERRIRPRGTTFGALQTKAGMVGDAAEKKESGPLKVGDRVEVPEGVRSAVSGGSVLPGTYQVMHDYSDGDVLIDNGSAVLVVRASDVRRV